MPGFFSAPLDEFAVTLRYAAALRSVLAWLFWRQVASLLHSR